MLFEEGKEIWDVHVFQRRASIATFGIQSIPSQVECLNTNTTLSPLKNIFEINLSLLIGFPFFPFDDLGVSVHIYN